MNIDLHVSARVAAVHRDRYELIHGDKTVSAKLKTSIYYDKETEPFPTVGDFVLLQDTLIVKTLPRKSFFSRRDPGPNKTREQAVAANFDICFVLSSLNHDFNLSRLERYAGAAWSSGATPVILLTKADLASEYQSQVLAAQGAAAGVDIIAVSTVSGQGLDEVKRYLKEGVTAVFLGSSGVGKSSLVNMLLGQDLMSVKSIREDDSRGRHTTTHRQLITLPSGAMIIDTPGMRELGLWDAGEGLSEVFSDVEEILSHGCRFSNCIHKTEPGCAVKAALESGELSAKRWQSYKKLKREEAYTDKAAKIAELKRRGREYAKFKRDKNNNKG